MNSKQSFQHADSGVKFLHGKKYICINLHIKVLDDFKYKIWLTSSCPLSTHTCSGVLPTPSVNVQSDPKWINSSWNMTIQCKFLYRYQKSLYMYVPFLSIVNLERYFELFSLYIYLTLPNTVCCFSCALWAAESLYCLQKFCERTPLWTYAGNLTLRDVTVDFWRIWRCCVAQRILGSIFQVFSQ